MAVDVAQDGEAKPSFKLDFSKQGLEDSALDALFGEGTDLVFPDKQMLAVNFQGNSFTGATIATLSKHFMQMASLTILDLNFKKNKIDDAGLLALAGYLEANWHLDKFQLKLDENKLTDEGISALGRGLTFQQELTALQITLNKNPKISDDGAMALVAGLVNSPIEVLELGFKQTRVTDMAAEVLAGYLTGQSSLSTLNVGFGSTGVSSAGFNMITTALSSSSPFNFTSVSLSFAKAKKIDTAIGPAL